MISTHFSNYNLIFILFVLQISYFQMNEDWSPKLNDKFTTESFKDKFIVKNWRAPVENLHVSCFVFIFSYYFQKKVKQPLIKSQGLDYLFIALVLSIVFTVQAILAVGSYSGTILLFFLLFEVDF